MKEEKEVLSLSACIVTCLSILVLFAAILKACWNASIPYTDLPQLNSLHALAMVYVASYVVRVIYRLARKGEK